MTISVPRGFRVAGVHCGLKSNPQKEDLTLVVSERPAVAAGVYTENVVCAAPVVLDRSRTPSRDIRAVVINSGCANACTGERGQRDARQMADWAAEACGAGRDQALVMSTGVIGEHLQMEKIRAGITAAAARLAEDAPALTAAARGIMTTDTVHKLAGRRFELDDGRTVEITGLAKGSGMIGPNMATMLGVLLTDAPLEPDVAQSLLGEVADDTFNCLSVDGHTSTNDSVLLLASGAAGGAALAAEQLVAFRGALGEVCEELARAIADDGEGASHLVTIRVEGCVSQADARRIAKAIANSPLVKTAIAGADPNWGRIVSAAGYSGVRFDPEGVSLKLNGFLLYERGQPVPFDAEQVSASIRASRETSVMLSLSEGEAHARFWTCDFTAEYIRINADYHT